MLVRLSVQSSLIGTIPPEIAQRSSILDTFPQLDWGPVPSALGRLTKLEFLDVRDKLLTASRSRCHLICATWTLRSTELEALFRMRTDLFVSHNELSGFCEHWREYSHKGSRACQQQLGWYIARLFSPLSSMEVLDMAGNSLNGTIPSSLTILPALAVLLLTQNRFVGSTWGKCKTV